MADIVLVTQAPIETVRAPDDPAVGARVTQSPVETLRQGDPPATTARLTQASVEDLRQNDAPTTTARLTQAAVEIGRAINAAGTAARCTQAAVEIIYPFGCYTYVPPAPDPGPPSPRHGSCEGTFFDPQPGSTLSPLEAPLPPASPPPPTPGRGPGAHAAGEHRERPIPPGQAKKS
jgi:hypothetical protein